MMTPSVQRLIVLCAFAAVSGCGSPWPTAPEMEASLKQATDEAVQSVRGPWSGLSAGGAVRVEFSLTQAADGRLQGTGTMREQTAAAVPITVSGTYNRPNLSLTFSGMVYEGRHVVGAFAAAYTSFAGVNGTLRLSGDGYERSLSFFLQEGPPPPASLGGRLTDAVTGAPVTGATVSVQGTSVTSSGTGHYGFNPNLTAGTFPVTVIHARYVEVTRDVDIAPFRIVDFKLQPK